MRPHVAALLLTCIHAFAPTPPPRAPRQTKVYFFDKLAESIKGATDLLSGKSRMTEANTKGALRDIRRALLDADVSKPLSLSPPTWYHEASCCPSLRESAARPEPAAAR